jgi:hypothetical protein
MVLITAAAAAAALLMFLALLLLRSFLQLSLSLLARAAPAALQ